MPSIYTHLTAPNLLSLFRITAGPAVVALLLSNDAVLASAALFLMVLAELSDIADGALARSRKQETQLGRFLDPASDSIYHLTVFLAFLANGWMSAWMLFIIYARDLVSPYLHAFARQARIQLRARSSGKIKSAVHAAAQLTVVASANGVFGTSVLPMSWAIQMALIAAVAASLYSLLDYINEMIRMR